MAGKIKKMIEEIIRLKSQGDPVLANTTRAKIILKGVSIKNYTDISEDDPIMMKKMNQIAQDFGVVLDL